VHRLRTGLISTPLGFLSRLSGRQIAKPTGQRAGARNGREIEMTNPWVVSAVVTVGLVLPAIRVGAQEAPAISDTYTWSGQLIAFDVDAHVITVKAPVRGDQAHTELSRFTPGDRILLTWSGYDAHTDAISRAVRIDPASNWRQPFTLPAEFVKYEAGSQYLTFIVEAPETNFDAIKSLRPGEWVTRTANQPSNDREASAADIP
jgi:hypothetical protein